MGETLLRLRRIRVADKLNDQHTAAEILNALVASITEEDLQEFILSQVKRIIHGNNPGTWRDDFGAAGILSLQEISQTGALQMAANCQATDLIGDVVYVTGDQVGGLPQVSRVDVTDPFKMPGVAVIIAKSAPTDCTILRYGLLSMSGLTPGRTYVVDASGRPSLVPPVAPPGGYALIQVVGAALDSTRLILNPSFNLTRIRP